MLVMKAEPRGPKWARPYQLVILMLFLRKIQRNRTVSFAFNKLLHFRIRTCADLVRRALGDDVAVAKHDHSRRDTKSAGHIMADNHCRHAPASSQVQC